MIDPISSSLDPELLKSLLPKVFISSIIGIAIGFMRESENKPAGIKTHMLLCLGATIFTYISYLSAGVHGDTSRVVSQIVTGIGFLGAGTIFKIEDKIHGLTSAAFIWVVCSLGVLVGLGGYLLAIIIAFFIIIVSYGFIHFERAYFKIDKKDL
jgi:putative Mg2+ transporter-C (MgtC) family protein